MGVKNLNNWELKEPLVLCIAKNFKHKKLQMQNSYCFS